MICYGIAANGRFVPDDKDMVKELLQHYEGVELEVTILRKSHIASDAQRRYYRGVVCRLISDWTGYSPAEVHEELLSKMFLTDTNIVNGVEKDYTQSTTAISTVRMEAFLSDCREWAMRELNVFIPLPNETL
jgi:hypothetical protein